MLREEREREREREHNIMQVGLAGELEHRTKSGLPVLGGGGREAGREVSLCSDHLTSFPVNNYNLMDTEWFSWLAGPHHHRSD